MIKFSQDEIIDFFRYNNEKLFHWEYECQNKRYNLIIIIFLLIVFLLFSPLIVFIPFGLLALLSSEIAFLLSIVAFLILFFCICFMYLNILIQITETEFLIFSDFAILTLSVLSSNLLLFVMSSSVFFPNELFPSSISWIDWYQFYLGNTMSITTFGIVDLIGLVQTKVEGVGLIGNVMLMIYRGLIASTLIEMLTRYILTIVKRNEFIGTATEFKVHTRKFKVVDFVVTLTGELAPIRNPIIMNSGDLFDVLDSEW